MNVFLGRHSCFPENRSPSTAHQVAPPLRNFEEVPFLVLKIVFLIISFKFDKKSHKGALEGGSDVALLPQNEDRPEEKDGHHQAQD
jgi:hypothetical protein